MKITDILFSFEGRINRLQYWISLLGVFALGFAMMAGTHLLYKAGGGCRIIGIAIICLWLCAHFWAFLAISVKRWHDLNLTGGMMFLWLIPFAGPLIVLGWIGISPGTEGRNRYGRDSSKPRRASDSSSPGNKIPQ